MVFNQRSSRSRRSKRRSTTTNRRNNNRNPVDLMQLVRSRSRYHPYEFDNSFTPMSATRRSQRGNRNTRHDMNQFNRSVYGEISPYQNAISNEGREEMGTNTSLTSFPALAQPQELPTTSMATHSATKEKDKEKEIDTIDKDNKPHNNDQKVFQPKCLTPISQTPSKSSSNENNTTDECPSSVSFTEEIGSSMGLSNKHNSDTAGSSSDIEKTYLPPIFAELIPTQNSSENSAVSDSTVDVRQDDMPPQNSLVSADEKAGGDGEHNNNSVIEIEITVTNANETNSDEDEYEGGDEET